MAANDYLPPNKIGKMVTAIIVAAGKGTRMGPDRDKLFLEVAGQPVIAHTWRRFDRARMIDNIVVVVREGMQSAFEELASHLELTKPYKLEEFLRTIQETLAQR